MAHLCELRVRDLGVIEEVTVVFGPGMTALTGETGAGKTLLVGALSLLLGGRGDPALVRSGADEAMVEARFGGEGDGDDLVLARAVSSTGRSRAWIDGRMASIGALGETARTLVELHGQHQHRSLVRADAQREALDRFAGIDHGPLRLARARLLALRAESADLGGDAHQRAREVDMLRFQIEEIEGVAIEDAGEDGRLEEEEARLADADAHRRAASDALEALTGSGASAIDRLATASGALSGRPALGELDRRIRASMGELADLADELRSVVETWEDDPARLEAVRSRRQVFFQLERKYGAGLAAVLAFAGDARSKLETIVADEARADRLDGELAVAAAELAAAEAAVAAARRDAAPRLAAEVESTLRSLAMPAARITVTVDGAGAADDVTFGLAANRGESVLPLAKAASGGELARTMLALRLVLTEGPAVMVFDEVDAGVGGAAAVTVGRSLADVAERAQVLVVTHLAQVAAQAGAQLAIRKVERDDRTVSEVVPLDTEGRVVELARMLSGRPESASARRHARELLAGLAVVSTPEGPPDRARDHEVSTPEDASFR